MMKVNFFILKVDSLVEKLKKERELPREMYSFWVWDKLNSFVLNKKIKPGMIESQKIKELLFAIKPELFKRYPISRLAIFGSVARNETTPLSDVDILVEFNKPIGFQFFNLAKELENYLQMPVDLVSRNGIKPSYFAEIEPDLMYV